MEYITAFGGADEQATEINENEGKSDSRNMLEKASGTQSSSNLVHRKSSREGHRDHGRMRSRDRSRDSSRRQKRETRWSTSDRDDRRSSPRGKHRHKSQHHHLHHSHSSRQLSHGHPPSHRHASHDHHSSATPGRSLWEYRTTRHRGDFSRSRSRYTSQTKLYQLNTFLFIYLKAGSSQFTGW